MRMHKAGIQSMTGLNDDGFCLRNTTMISGQHPTIHGMRFGHRLNRNCQSSISWLAPPYLYRRMLKKMVHESIQVDPVTWLGSTLLGDSSPPASWFVSQQAFVLGHICCLSSRQDTRLRISPENVESLEPGHAPIPTLASLPGGRPSFP